MYYRVDFKLCVLWILLVLQVLLVVYYLLMAPSSYTVDYSTSTPNEFPSKSYPIKFVAPSSPRTVLRQKEWQGYLTEANHFSLPNIVATNYFVKLNNDTECFLPGTEVGYTKRLHNRDSEETKCECKRGWHGKDCGQPEVIWRAFIASRQKISPRRRAKPRRIIHGFPIVGLETTIAEIKLNELAHVVDYYIVSESNCTSSGGFKDFHFKQKLNEKGFIPESIRKKLLYIPQDEIVKRDFLWHRGRATITNLKSDDLYIDSADPYQIPNPKALLFFKLYDGWPLPVAFRLRWSAYGFFWQHPRRTITAPGAYTVGIMEDSFPHRITGQDDASMYGLVVGDLNHYGGWYCSWCLEPNDIVTMLQWTRRDESPVDWNKLSQKKIDIAYIEDLVGTGLWLDGATALIRKSQHHDTYFAPEHVTNNTWKYDFLYTNFYSKLDYYNN